MSVYLYAARCDVLIIAVINIAIETETEVLPWAAAGSNVSLYLIAVDPIHLNIGSVLCPVSNPIPLASTFTARIIVFDIQVPILAGTSVNFI